MVVDNSQVWPVRVHDAGVPAECSACFLPGFNPGLPRTIDLSSHALGLPQPLVCVGKLFASLGDLLDGVSCGGSEICHLDETKQLERLPSVPVGIPPQRQMIDERGGHTDRAFAEKALVPANRVRPFLGQRSDQRSAHDDH